MGRNIIKNHDMISAAAKLTDLTDQSKERVVYALDPPRFGQPWISNTRIKTLARQILPMKHISGITSVHITLYGSMAQLKSTNLNQSRNRV